MAHETDITALGLVGAHRVRLTFSDGARRDSDLSPLLTGPVFDIVRKDATEPAATPNCDVTTTCGTSP